MRSYTPRSSKGFIRLSPQKIDPLLMPLNVRSLNWTYSRQIVLYFFSNRSNFREFGVQAPGFGLSQQLAQQDLERKDSGGFIQVSSCTGRQRLVVVPAVGRSGEKDHRSIRISSSNLAAQFNTRAV